MALAETQVRTSTPARILDAAFEAIRDFGLPRVTVEDVAQRAGLSRQTVYRYFPSKDELIIALVSRDEETLRPILDGTTRAIMSYILTPADRPVDTIATAMAGALVTVLHKGASA